MDQIPHISMTSLRNESLDTDDWEDFFNAQNGDYVDAQEDVWVGID